MTSIKKRPSILFICTANMIRSPMAAALFRARLRDERADWQEWWIDSAGTWALEGEPATRNAQLVLARRGLDISDHRAKTVTPDLLKDFDLILTMEPGQKEGLQVEFPELAGRIFLLSEMAGLAQTVEDPIGRPLIAYEQAAQKIDQMLAEGMNRIVMLVTGELPQKAGGTGIF